MPPLLDVAVTLPASPFHDGRVGRDPVLRDRARERLGVSRHDSLPLRRFRRRVRFRRTARLHVVEKDAPHAPVLPARGDVKVLVAPPLTPRVQRPTQPPGLRRAHVEDARINARVVRVAQLPPARVELARVVFVEVVRREVRAAAVPPVARALDREPPDVRAERWDHRRRWVEHERQRGGGVFLAPRGIDLGAPAAADKWRRSIGLVGGRHVSVIRERDWWK
eukprot:29954-Pelagococcus_subviridis.AAC.8